MEVFVVSDLRQEMRHWSMNQLFVYVTADYATDNVVIMLGRGRTGVYGVKTPRSDCSAIPDILYRFVIPSLFGMT